MLNGAALGGMRDSSENPPIKGGVGASPPAFQCQTPPCTPFDGESFSFIGGAALGGDHAPQPGG